MPIMIFSILLLLIISSYLIFAVIIYASYYYSKFGHCNIVLQNCQDRWKWGLHGIFLSFLDVFGPLIPNLDDAKSYLLSILRFGCKKSIFGKKSFFFYIFNKVEAGFLFVIGWSWFYRLFCIKIKNIAYDRSVFNDKSVILRTFVIKVRCAIYLYFIVFANTFSTKCEFIIDITILAAGQNWAFCDFWWKSIIFRIFVKVIFFVGVHFMMWALLHRWSL